MFRPIVLTFVFLSLLVNSNAQTPDTIPFVLTPFNNIYLNGILNHTDSLKLMFHTGENGVSITEQTLENIPVKDTVNAVEAEAWGGKGTAQYFRHNHIAIGQQKFDSLSIWVDKHSGQLTDGKFGPLLFEGKIIELDYNHNLFILHHLPLTKKQKKRFQKLPLTLENGLLFVEGKLKIGNKMLHQKFMLHTGYGGTVLIDDEFAKQHQLGKTLKVIDKSSLKDAYGNTLITQKAILPIFKLDRSKFKNLSISFFSGSIGRQKISVLGNGLLKEYNLILDIEGGYLYLKRNHA